MAQRNTTGKDTLRTAPDLKGRVGPFPGKHGKHSNGTCVGDGTGPNQRTDMKKWTPYVLALSGALAIGGLAYNRASAEPPPAEDWGPDTYVEMDLVPREKYISCGGMPSYALVVEREIGALTRKKGERFANWRSRNTDNDTIREALDINASDQALDAVREIYLAEQDMILDQAESALQYELNVLDQTTSKWLHIAPLYAERPVPPDQSGGAGKYWEYAAVEYGGWHGYALFDSIDFPDLEGFLSHAEYLTNVELESVKAKFQ